MPDTILGSYQLDNDYVRFSRLEDGTYVVDHHKGEELVGRQTSTGYDDAMIHYRLMIRKLRKRTDGEAAT